MTPLLSGFVPFSKLWGSKATSNFPSEGSARWFLRINRDALVKAEALAVHRGRMLVHPERFATAVERIATGAAAGSVRSAPPASTPVAETTNASIKNDAAREGWIVKRRLDGWKWADIAGAAGVSNTRCMQIFSKVFRMSRHRAVHSLRRDTPPRSECVGVFLERGDGFRILFSPRADGIAVRIQEGMSPYRVWKELLEAAEALDRRYSDEIAADILDN